jgi:uncharacterized protein
MVEKYFLVIIAGILGAMISERFNIPGGAVIGAMLGSGAVTLAFPGGVYLSPRVATGAQIILGILLGMTFDRTFLVMGPKVLPIAVGSTLILLLVSVCMAYLASRIGLVDFGTALFGFSPGGMSGMAILAKTEGHNPPLVAFLHMVRVFTLFLVVPLLVRVYLHFK